MTSDAEGKSDLSGAAYDTEERTTSGDKANPMLETRTERPSSKEAFLVSLVGRSAGRRFPVKDETVIGRHPGAEVRLTADDISRSHARICSTTPYTYSIEDLGSRNGTMVNGIPLTRQHLSFGDKIQLGSSTILLFTYRDDLEDQLRELQKLEAIGQLAGAIAHDFNNLLAAVMTNINYLQGRPNLDEDTKECLDDVEQAARRGIDYTRQLLGFAERGKFEERPIEIQTLVKEVLRLMRRNVDRSIHFEVHVVPDLVLLGDRSQLHQVLLNLLLNARDAMPDGGTLTIQARAVDLGRGQALAIPFIAPGPFVKITVQDTGMGMDEQVRARIFEPFFSTKERGKGTGLGLATAYGIVKNHGGSMQVESIPGQGTTFTLYLPRVEAPAPSKATRPVPVAFPQSEDSCILLVDDEDGVRNGIRRLLQRMGYQVLEACDGTEAIQLFKKHQEKIKLVLLDLIMPTMGGEETYHALQEMDPQVKVVVISGFAEESRVRMLLDAGIISFLQKPFDLDRLAQALAEAQAADDDYCF